MPKVKPQNKPIEFQRNFLPRNIRWMFDMDYLAKLSPREARWMQKFIREYINGNVRKGDRTALHKSAALRRDCYARKNAQNRDMMSILNSNGKIDRLDGNGESNSTAMASFVVPKK